jgi:hypothetical protein
MIEEILDAGICFTLANNQVLQPGRHTVGESAKIRVEDYVAQDQGPVAKV